MPANNYGTQHGANTRSRALPLPEKFKCHVGGEWAKIDMFSKNQLAKWENRKRSPNDGVTPANIGITCRIHLGQPATQLKCNGPCGLWKSRNKFSASQRRNKLGCCADCVQWQSQIDYDSVPVPHPNGDVSLDEMNTGTQIVDPLIPFTSHEPEDGVDTASDGSYCGENGTFNSDEYDDDEDDDGEDHGDDDEYLIRTSDLGVPAAIKSMASLSIGTSRTASHSGTTIGKAQRNMGNQAPVPKSLVPSTMSALSSGSRHGIDASSVTSRTPAENRNLATTSLIQRSYNAYGPSGEAMMRTAGRAQSETSGGIQGDGRQAAQRATDRRRPDRNGFARPDMRRVFDTIIEFHGNAQDGIEIQDSGSEDEM